MSLFILPHFGLGDAILCNGLVRTLALKQPIIYPCSKEYLTSISFMFRDYAGINVVAFESPDEAEKSFDKHDGPKLKLGFRAPETNPFCKGCHFDESFYMQAGLDPGLIKSSFHINADPKIELPVPEYPYIFAHGVSVCVPDAVTITPDPSTPNFFSYAGILRNALQIHCKDSSFACWCECGNIGVNRRWYHAYAKKMIIPEHSITLSRDWNIIGTI